MLFSNTREAILIDEITEKIDQVLKCSETLYDENNKMKNEIYKDEKMQEMSKKFQKMREDYYRGFPISEKESLAIQEWKEEHEKIHHKNDEYHGCGGGGYNYIFYPTAIGTSGVCECEACSAAARQYACENGNYNRKKYDFYMKHHNANFEFQEIT